MSTTDRPVDSAARRSEHQQRVDQFLRGFGLPLPPTPTLANKELLVLCARLLLEETLEWIDAAGIDVVLRPECTRHAPLRLADLLLRSSPDREPDLAAMAKEAADVSVVTMEALSVNGIADVSLLAAVDENNLQKLATGRRNPETGKFEKHPDHPKPDVRSILSRQRGE